jgi:hypothetical protein
LAVGYVAMAYLFYVAGSLPEGKDPQKTDERIIEKYGITESKLSRCRQNKAGIAPVQYLRFGRFSLFQQSPEKISFFREQMIRNIRVHPIRFAG